MSEKRRELKWEPIDSNSVERTKIPGGWLVRFWIAGETGASGLTFVPDPEHKWDGKSLD